MTDPKLVERAREITSKHLQRPDWIDIGYKDCFVCGTPLDKDEFNKRSASLVGEIAQALQSHGEEVRRRTIEECAKVASEFAPKPIEETYFSEREHDFIRNKVECVVIAIRKLLEVKGA